MKLSSTLPPNPLKNIKRAALFSGLLIIAAMMAQNTLPNTTCPASNDTFLAALAGFAYFGLHCWYCMLQCLNSMGEGRA